MTVYFNASRRRWMFNFRLAGKRYAGYCRDALGAPVTSKSAARQAEGVEKRRAVIAPKLACAGDLTLAQVVADLTPAWQRQAHWPNRKRYIREIVGFFGVDAAVTSIDEGRVLDYVRYAQAAPAMQWHGGPLRDPANPAHARFWKPSARPRGPATINLYLGVLRQCLARAVQIRDPVTGKPALERAPAVPELAVPKRRARPIPDNVLSEILGAVPAHVADAIALTLYFGFRRGEVFSLELHQVDFDAGGIRLFAENVKDAEDTFLPGAPAAMALLQRLAGQARAREVTHLVTWRRHAKVPWLPIARPKGAWERVMKMVEKKFGRRFRWHDIRASFITHVAITSGAVAAQALARHSEYSTTAGYVEVADEMRRIAADRAGERPALRKIHG